MFIKIPEIYKQLNKDLVFKTLEKNYSNLGPTWVSHQIEWFNGVYSAFKDHDKFVIIIFLTKKTLDIYSSNLVKLSYDEFFSSQTIEIEKFNISEIAIELMIPKESARRKVMELENEGVIRRKGKKIIIDRSCFNYSKPINSIKRISTFLAYFLTICKEEKMISKKITSKEIEEVIKNNFSIIWNFYYDMQIPMMVNYKKIFKDYDTFHIYSACVVNQHFVSKRMSETYTDRDSFIKSFFTGSKGQGINAMSISEITGIPRATVIRKLQKLVKKGNLKIDKKKHYRLRGDFTNTLKPIQRDNLFRLANFSSKVFNLSNQN